jgi:NAD(P)-dependent dehydrogenase (short-subunit alcohol dehydrogenase family)
MWMKKILLSQGTIVNITSMAYFVAEVDTEDPNFVVSTPELYLANLFSGQITNIPYLQNGRTYNPWKAYGRSKTANILFTYSLGRALKERGFCALVADPGMMPGTQLLANSSVSQEHLLKVMSFSKKEMEVNSTIPDFILKDLLKLR